MKSSSKTLPLPLCLFCLFQVLRGLEKHINMCTYAYSKVFFNTFLSIYKTSPKKKKRRGRRRGPVIQCFIGTAFHDPDNVRSVPCLWHLIKLVPYKFRND